MFLLSKNNASYVFNLLTFLLSKNNARYVLNLPTIVSQLSSLFASKSDKPLPPSKCSKSMAKMTTSHFFLLSLVPAVTQLRS